MRLVVEATSSMTFNDGSPVRAASAIAAFGDGWLVVQDDATHAAWCRPGSVTSVRVVEAVDGLEVFSSAAGTKHMKPDFEAACAVSVNDEHAVLLLGSGSADARMRASLITASAAGPVFTAVDLESVYRDVAVAMGIDRSHVNLEGACQVGDRLRWFQRGNLAVGAPTASVDVDLTALLAAMTGTGAVDKVEVGGLRRYDLGTVDDVALAVTDAVALTDGRILVSAAAEDTPNAVDDGPVIAAALALLDDDGVLAIAELPASADGPYKVEGLTVSEVTHDGLRLLAVVDADDPFAASHQLTLRLRW